MTEINCALSIKYAKDDVRYLGEMEFSSPPMAGDIVDWEGGPSVDWDAGPGVILVRRWDHHRSLHLLLELLDEGEKEGGKGT